MNFTSIKKKCITKKVEIETKRKLYLFFKIAASVDMSVQKQSNGYLPPAKWTEELRESCSREK